ncbi:hypothetical protein O181_128131 [Austropuccinia psidii MF-1]|uniref:Uncharacterized protein n=1 Tax=Austropuccinia psidii MF-1 TaxID=1389203 RepID=A0A9Q3KYA9_9BASI|nr:hypothetical protein [Austropuccinia psidii MF-1]
MQYTNTQVHQLYHLIHLLSNNMEVNVPTGKMMEIGILTVFSMRRTTRRKVYDLDSLCKNISTLNHSTSVQAIRDEANDEDHKVVDARHISEVENGKILIDSGPSANLSRNS